MDLKPRQKPDSKQKLYIGIKVSEKGFGNFHTYEYTLKKDGCNIAVCVYNIATSGITDQMEFEEAKLGLLCAFSSE